LLLKTPVANKIDPIIIHEILAERLGDAVKNGLQSIKSNCSSTTKCLIDNISSQRSADVKLRKDWLRSPNRQFHLEPLYFSAIILEIAYAQSEDKLAKAAKDYVLESYGQVQKAIGIIVDYKTACATLSICCPTFDLDSGQAYRLSEAPSSGFWSANRSPPTLFWS